MIPHTWYFVCSGAKLPGEGCRPLGFQIAHKSFVAFRDSRGVARVLSGRCCHFGSSLAAGKIVDDCVECPLHGWRFDGDGVCRLIPAGDPIPQWAGQRSYPVTERFGQVFFFFGETPTFEIQGFEGIDDEELLCAAPLFFDVGCPWYVIGANGFDGQHFRVSHNRVPIEVPKVDSFDDGTIRISMKLKIIASGIVDRFIERVLGSTINFSIVNRGGNVMAVTSLLKRSTTYGFVNVIPVAENSCRVVNVVMLRKSKGRWARIFLDYINSVIRREFIRRFLGSEQPQLEGCDILLDHCQPADNEMRQYVEWLTSIHKDDLSARDGGLRAVS